MRSRDKEKHIFTSTRSMVTKLYEVMAYEKSSLPTMVKWHNSHMTNKKRYICFYKFMATNLDKVMTYGMDYHAQSLMIL